MLIFILLAKFKYKCSNYDPGIWIRLPSQRLTTASMQINK